MTATTLPLRPALNVQLKLLNLFAHLGGAVLTVVYFHEVDPTATADGVPVTAGEIAFFVVAFGLMYLLGSRFIRSWQSAPSTHTTPAVPTGSATFADIDADTSADIDADADTDRARRRLLMMPGLIALVSCGGWVLAALLWGVVQPLIAGYFEPWQALRKMFGITFVAGSVVTAITYFGSERLLRSEVPHLFPDGRLSAVRAPRLRVRARLLAVFLLIGLLPLAVLSVAALTRADALRSADPATAALIVRNLRLMIVVVALGGVAVSISLAFMVAASVAQPLRELQRAMSEVRRGRLDTQCAVVSNDEIGAAAEGFNAMVQGLRERERIRETFGRYVSPQVRDEILEGRVSGDGAMREVTILFADLRDFTPWVEASPPREVVADLNAYFSEMDAAIRAHGGLVLQYLGDEIEAVFGAPLDNPRHADDAVAAARAMSRRLRDWNAGRSRAGKPALRHGIGIHTGAVIAGNIGSAQRQSYALVGDAVNVASRIQSLNKEFGTQMLVSGDTHARLVATDGLEPMPAVRVKGRRAEVSVFVLDRERNG